MIVRRQLFIGAITAALTFTFAGAMAESPPPFVVRGLPGDGQEAMKSLAGNWRVNETLYLAIGSPEHPAISDDLVAHREWIGDGRFLREVTKGTIAGSPSWREGTLGYSSMDRRFEWVTQDSLNTNMMIYLAASNSGSSFPASLKGTFTDQGVLGEKFAGKTIAQRTVITIINPNRNIFDLYFTPPGEPERLAIHYVYTRIEE
jgi:hypothetical protein